MVYVKKFMHLARLLKKREPTCVSATPNVGTVDAETMSNVATTKD